MTESLFERVRQIMADVLDVELEQLSTESSMTTIEKWDSFQHLNLILALEQEFGMKFIPEEAEEMTNFGAIAAVIEEKLP